MAAAIAGGGNRTIQDVLMYHVLNGTYNSSNFTDTPLFVPTMLNDTLLSNVTGGQRVEAVKMNNNVTFFSGLLMNSTVTRAVRATFS
jgi:hypothetical protein